MTELMAAFKALRLHGMATGYAELLGNGGPGVESAEWIVRHLLEAEKTDRALRSVRYQMHAARFPLHRDLAGFEFEQSKVDRRQIEAFATLAFTEKAENIVWSIFVAHQHLTELLGLRLFRVRRHDGPKEQLDRHVERCKQQENVDDCDSCVVTHDGDCVVESDKSAKEERNVDYGDARPLSGTSREDRDNAECNECDYQHWNANE